MSVVECRNEAALAQQAALVGAALEPGLQIDLEGELGAGKTTWVRALLRRLGYAGPVRSPSYTLVEPYQVEPWQFYHLDLYRLSDAEELEFLGWRDWSRTEINLLIEWPQHGRPLLPLGDLVIHFAYAPQGRHLSYQAHSEAGQRVVKALAATS